MLTLAVCRTARLQTLKHINLYIWLLTSDEHCGYSDEQHLQGSAPREHMHQRR